MSGLLIKLPFILFMSDMLGILLHKCFAIFLP